MRTSRMRLGAVGLATAAIALAGCGGGSGQKASTTPASGGTSTTGSTGTSGGSGAIPPSTSITSPVWAAALTRRIAEIPGISSSQIQQIVHCTIQKEVSEGLKTIADVKAHITQANADAKQCALAAGVH